MPARSSWLLLGGVLGVVACGEVEPLPSASHDGSDGTSGGNTTPGASQDGTKPSGPSGSTDTPPPPPPTPTTPKPDTPPPAPTSCPTVITNIGGSNATIASSIALGDATYHLERDSPTLLQGLWNGPVHAVASTGAALTGTTDLERLSDNIWGAVKDQADSSRTVTAYLGMQRLGSFQIPVSTRTRSRRAEGLSPDGTKVVFQNGDAVAIADVVVGQDHWEQSATTFCAAPCELLWAKGNEAFVVSFTGAPTLLEKSFAAPQTNLGSVADPSLGRAIAAVTTNRVFFDGLYDDKVPVVLARASLSTVPFTWAEDEDILAVRERSDGTFDILSIFSGEWATSWHVTATGAELLQRRAEAHDSGSADACGFWADGKLNPYLD